MRCFVAVDVDGRQLEEAQTYLRGCVSGSFPALRQSHFTLCFLGEKNDAEVDVLKQKLSALCFPRFEAGLLGVGAFPSLKHPRVFWAGVGKGATELVRLQEEVAASINFVSNENVFFPHVTLARVKRVLDEKKVSEFASIYGKSFGTMPVGRVCLKKSVLGPNGTLHEELFGVGLQ